MLSHLECGSYGVNNSALHSRRGLRGNAADGGWKVKVAEFGVLVAHSYTYSYWDSGVRYAL